MIPRKAFHGKKELALDDVEAKDGRHKSIFTEKAVKMLFQEFTLLYPKAITLLLLFAEFSHPSNFLSSSFVAFIAETLEMASH